MSLPRIQDDLYMAVNGTWQQNTVIPPDKSVVSADSDLTDSIRNKIGSRFEENKRGTTSRRFTTAKCRTTIC